MPDDPRKVVDVVFITLCMSCGRIQSDRRRVCVHCGEQDWRKKLMPRDEYSRRLQAQAAFGL